MKSEDQFKDSIMINSMMIYSLEELESLPAICGDLYDTLNNIFEKLLKLKNNRFYNKKEVEAVFLLIHQEIKMINDTIIALSLNPQNIYEIILDCFEDLVHIYERREEFEAAGNLMSLRDFWFDRYKIEISK